MKLLNKYHKQRFSKDTLKALENVNQELKLKYNLKDDHDVLKLSVYKTALENKQFFETQFNAIRLANIDLWDNLSYTERNFILKCDLASEKVKRLSFKHEDTTITIPFFDVLMNGLYDKETAVLELPQFLKLYKDYHSRMVPLETYGLKPYIANMSLAKHVASLGHKIVLLDSLNSRYFVLEGEACLVYPILNTNHDEGKLLEAGKALLTSEDAFIDVCIEGKLLDSRCIKKIEKYRAKGKAY